MRRGAVHAAPTQNTHDNNTHPQNNTTTNYYLRSWQRAERFGLQPPPEVHAVLTAPGASAALQRALWEGRV